MKLHTLFCALFVIVATGSIIASGPSRFEDLSKEQQSFYLMLKEKGYSANIVFPDGSRVKVTKTEPTPKGRFERYYVNTLNWCTDYPIIAGAVVTALGFLGGMYLDQWIICLTGRTFRGIPFVLDQQN